MIGEAFTKIVRLQQKPVRRVIGLQSGTSADGLDAAVVEIQGAGEATNVRLLSYLSIPMAADLRRRLYAAATAPARELADLNFLLGEEFAKITILAIEKSGLKLADVDLIGSHGQTVCNSSKASGGLGTTLQIGEGAVIAERTGIPVICDFRVRDMAAGGEGAPLLPLAEYYAYRRPGQVRAMQNIGGVANVTVITDSRGGVFALETGPGNMAIDAAARAVSNGEEPFDRGGKRAAAGRVDRNLLQRLFALPFFSSPPPRSGGRDIFGEALVKPLVEQYAERPNDLLATLTRFTAETIRDSYAKYVEPRVELDEVLITGGGVHNRTLLKHLAELFDPIPVRPSSQVGIDPEARDAMCFAVLANETLHGLPSNIPVISGAVGPRVLGKIIL